MNEDNYLIRTRFTKNIDPNRIEEWLDANYTDEFVEVVDRQTGDTVAMQGNDPVPFVCPECGEPAYSILTSGGVKTYSHVNSDEDCTVNYE